MRRLHAAGAAAIVAVIGVAVACSFPSPELTDLPDATGDTSPTAPPRDVAIPPSDGAAIDAAIDAPIDRLEPPPDATKIDGDANIVVDGQVVNCDEDGDKFAKVGGGCGGFDCDDTNANVRPDQDYNTLAPLPGSGPGKGGDWNCRNGVEIQGTQNVGDCPNVALGCAKEGWVGAVACGTTSHYVKCEVDGLGCRKSVDDRLRPVGCR